MKFTKQLTLYITTLLIASTCYSNVIIRPALVGDVPALTKLNHKVMFEHFKPTIIKGYPDSPIAQNEELLNNFLNEYVAFYTAEFIKTLENSDPKNNGISVVAHPDNPKKIQAFCLFKEKDQQIHIDFLIVDKKLRGQGIGTMLLNNTINTFNDATHCELETLAYANEKTHAFYEKYGFKSTKELITIDERTPNTHIRYTLDIKK